MKKLINKIYNTIIPILNTSIHNNQYSNKNIKTISGTIKDTKTYTYPVNKIIRSKDKVKKRIRKK